MNYRNIVSDGELERYLESLAARSVDTIALDLEGEFNLHQYGEALCLIQIFDGTELVAIDPAGIAPRTLSALFGSRSPLKVMYDSLSDQALVQKCYGFGITTIYDLRPAAELLQFEKKDLGSVLAETLGIEIEKKKKFQRYNWTRRPIDREAIEYALSDVAYLLRLRKALIERLDHAKLREEFELANGRLQDRDFLADRTPRIFKSGQYQKLPRRAKTRFQKIYELRDNHARLLNVPPDTVINKQQMFSLSVGTLSPQSVNLNRKMRSDLRAQIVRQLTTILAESNG